jgi:hypothetical protein
MLLPDLVSIEQPISRVESESIYSIRDYDDVFGGITVMTDKLFLHSLRNYNTRFRAAAANYQPLDKA